MSGNPLVFAVTFPVDLAYVGVAAWWVYRDAQLPNPDKSMRKLRRWVLFVMILLALWQLFTFKPWQKGKPATHVPAELALSGMMIFGYWVGYIWVGDWCSYYFSKFHTPFPNAVYYGFGVASVLSGIFAGLRSVVPFLADDMWLYDLFMILYMVPLLFGMACCVKLAWDVRKLTKQRYIKVLTDADEDAQPLVNSSRRIHMCKVNFLVVYFALGFLSLVWGIPQLMLSLTRVKPGASIHTRPEAPLAVVLITDVSFWIPYGLIIWYSKFQWGADPLDQVSGETTSNEGMTPIDLDTMGTQV